MERSQERKRESGGKQKSFSAKRKSMHHNKRMTNFAKQKLHEVIQMEK